MSIAQRYHLRSPRYVLQASDDRLLRFASMDTRGQTSVTKVLNLSESGLAFEIHQDAAPSEGDVLKVEFDVPEQKKIACFATVVRVEQKPPAPITPRAEWHPLSEAGPMASEMIQLVGLQFRNLPSAYRRLLAQSLKDRAQNEVIIDWQSFRRKQFASFAGITIATIVILFMLALPCQSWLETLRSLL